MTNKPFDLRFVILLVFSWGIMFQQVYCFSSGEKYNPVQERCCLCNGARSRSFSMFPLLPCCNRLVHRSCFLMCGEKICIAEGGGSLYTCPFDDCQAYLLLKDGQVCDHFDDFLFAMNKCYTDHKIHKKKTACQNYKPY